jgi:hypothetical protein
MTVPKSIYLAGLITKYKLQEYTNLQSKIFIIKKKKKPDILTG